MLYIDKMPPPYTQTGLRSLAIPQPFCTLLLPPFFKANAQLWYSAYRGWVLICAASKNSVMDNFFAPEHVHFADKIREMVPGYDTLPCCQAIGIGYLSSVRFMERDKDEDLVMMPYKSNRWVFNYSHVQRIEPFDIKAPKALMDVKGDVLKKIKFV